MKANLVKADGTSTFVVPKNGTDFSLEELKEFVGGWIEIVWLNKTDEIMIINEEGKLMDLPLNHYGSFRLWNEKPHTKESDYIVGDVLICHRSQVK